MNEKKIAAALHELVNSVPFQRAKENLVFVDENGNYELFDTYVIAPKNNSFVVTKNKVYGSNAFSTLKNAVLWATSDKRQRYYVADRVIELDRKLVSLELSIKLHKKLYSKTDKLPNKAVYLNKFSDEIIQRDQINQELSDYLAEANRWQLNKFNQNNSTNNLTKR
jgi:hypothetical protein